MNTNGFNVHVTKLFYPVKAEFLDLLGRNRNRFVPVPQFQNMSKRTLTLTTQRLQEEQLLSSIYFFWQTSSCVELG